MKGEPMDLIDRKYAIRIVDSIDTWQAGWRGDAIESLKALPPVQPEIIRCRDCAKCQYDALFDQYWCNGREVREDFYCGDAERRTDD